MTLNCKKLVPMLTDYVDGTLSSDNAWKVRMHLSVCPACAKLAEQLERTVGLMRNASPAVLPLHFDGKLAERIQAIGPAHVPATWLARARFKAQVQIDGLVSAKRRRLAFSAPLAVASVVVAGMLMLLPGGNFLGSREDAATAPPAFEQTHRTGSPDKQYDESLAKAGEVLIDSNDI